MDALLGAAGLGIVQLFPDTDPAFEGASSMTLLERARRAGGDERRLEVENADVNDRVPAAASLGLSPGRRASDCPRPSASGRTP